jgi:hypothetical protein
MKPEKALDGFSGGARPRSIRQLVRQKPSDCFLKVNFPLICLGLSEPFLSCIKTHGRFAGPKYMIGIIMEFHQGGLFLAQSIDELNYINKGISENAIMVKIA